MDMQYNRGSLIWHGCTASGLDRPFTRTYLLTYLLADLLAGIVIVFLALSVTHLRCNSATQMI